MPNVVFFGTAAREDVVGFYTDRLGFAVWLSQPGCTILARENLLVGFCDRDGEEVDPGADGMVTVVLDDRAAVQQCYDRLADVAEDTPAYNDTYDIYQFFGTDPDGRPFEVQCFEHDVPALES